MSSSSGNMIRHRIQSKSGSFQRDTSELDVCKEPQNYAEGITDEAQSYPVLFRIGSILRCVIDL